MSGKLTLDNDTSKVLGVELSRGPAGTSWGASLACEIGNPISKRPSIIFGSTMLSPSAGALPDGNPDASWACRSSRAEPSRLRFGATTDDPLAVLFSPETGGALASHSLGRLSTSNLRARSCAGCPVPTALLSLLDDVMFPSLGSGDGAAVGCAMSMVGTSRSSPRASSRVRVSDERVCRLGMLDAPSVSTHLCGRCSRSVCQVDVVGVTWVPC